MKFSHFRSVPSRRAGFTLVELLVVMAIIAILAAATLGIGTAVINSAKRAKASTAASQIQTAVLAYYTEYSTYPYITSTAPTTDILVSTQANWQPMAVILSGGVDPGNPGGGQYSSSAPYNLNTRQIAFLTFNKGDLDSSVTPAVPKIPFKTAAGATLYYQMAIDTDYTNILGDNGATTCQPPDFAGQYAALASPFVAYPLSGNTKQIAGGVALWGCCDPATASTTNYKLWIRTY